MKRVSGRDVARAAGVSQSTVSRVMTADPRIGSETRRRVLEAARSLSYDMRPASGRWSIGVLIGFSPQDANGYYAGIFSAVLEILERRGLQMVPIWKHLEENVELRPLRGILVLSHPEMDALAAAYPLPLVRINGPSCHLQNICSVNQDSAAGAAMAVRHLWKLGHRDIRYVSLEGREAESRKATLRWQGFLNSMRSLGCEDPERQCIFFPGCSHADQPLLIRAFDEAFREGCTALICVNSQHTLQVNAALHAMRVRVPEEISLIDWEFEGVSEYLDPPRTTVAVDFPKLATVALDLLCRMAETRQIQPDRLVLPKLILRRSTAPVRT